MGPLSVDPRIARLLRVHLRLPRVLVEDILRAQCFVEVWRYSDCVRNETPYVRGERHGTMRWWHADGSRWYEVPYVNGAEHGTVTWWSADGSQESEIPYVDGKRHGTAIFWGAGDRRETPYVHGKRHGTEIRWRADGSLHCIVTYVNGVTRGVDQAPAQ